MEMKGLNASNRGNPSDINAPLDMVPVIQTLNRILELEMAGAVLYTHCSFIVVGFDRLLTVKWLEGQASEALVHARTAGELVTQLGSLPSLGIAPLKPIPQNQHDTTSILRLALAHEQSAIACYEALLAMVMDKNVMLDEYARQHIYIEMQHIGEIEKMLRRPGEIKSLGAA